MFAVVHPSPNPGHSYSKRKNRSVQSVVLQLVGCVFVYVDMELLPDKKEDEDFVKGMAAPAPTATAADEAQPFVRTKFRKGLCSNF